VGLSGEFLVLAAARFGRFEVSNGPDHHRWRVGRSAPAGALRSNHRKTGPRQHNLHRICILRSEINRFVRLHPFKKYIFIENRCLRLLCVVQSVDVFAV